MFFAETKVFVIRGEKSRQTFGRHGFSRQNILNIVQLTYLFGVSKRLFQSRVGPGVSSN